MALVIKDKDLRVLREHMRFVITCNKDTSFEYAVGKLMGGLEIILTGEEVEEDEYRS